MDDKEYQYDDDELARMVNQAIQAADTEFQSKIWAQREEAYEYYYGQRPRASSGRSSHVSMDVWDAVEAFKAKLVETFTSCEDAVSFDPIGDEDVEDSKLATRYCNHVFYEQNDGFKILREAAHDAGLEKVCIVKRFWEEKQELVLEEFGPVPMEQAQVALSQEDLEVVSLEELGPQPIPVPTPMGPQMMPVNMVRGEVRRKKTQRQTRVMVVPPEDFFLDPHASCIARAKFAAERVYMTKGDLVAMGFDKEVVDELQANDDSSIDRYRGRYEFDDTAPEDLGDMNFAKRVKVVEAYLRVDMDGDGLEELWQIMLADKTVLSKEQVEEIPYLMWSPFQVAHKSIGLSLADVTMSIQKSQSALLRSLVDNALLTNTGRIVADIKLIKNPRDLLDNKIGGVINATFTQGGAPVTALPVTPISPATLAAVEELKQEKEARTGHSRLAQGLNQDAVSRQNAYDMVDNLAKKGEYRTAIMARSFAYEVMIPLFKAIYRLGKENGDVVTLNVDGEPRQIEGSGFQEREQMRVKVALAPEERRQQGATLVNLYQMMGQDPELGAQFGGRERFKLLTAAMDLLGVENDGFVADPRDPEVQKAAQAAQQERERMLMLEVQEREKARAATLFGLNIQREKFQGDQELKRQELALKAVTQADEQALDEREFEHEKVVDNEELDIKRAQVRGGAR